MSARPGEGPPGMTRKKLEALVWKHKHSDFRGTTDGVRYVLRPMKNGGTCTVPLSELSATELVQALPRLERVDMGYQLWWIVVSTSSMYLLGVFGEALLAEAQACAAKVRRDTGFAPDVEAFVGAKPKVGDSVPIPWVLL